ncbi:hypothetical protein AX774_g5351 [Zancudomyces culisetae]|uniref:Tetrapyrrole biosynthesis uroporphyrinogen III synthase domain-containing protein n=1 Tax=Zancudomyces culisetae TaxID=1213189 RepID=A0A1R1PJQ3_ZANCU|nr:hypothetical protein AX774_g5351 [Zancudomyces culisetae]|eukprot:OMH81196.1 hypothetical protein AX774_g5351 [Zancudomyces culisetae]
MKRAMPSTNPQSNKHTIGYENGCENSAEIRAQTSRELSGMCNQDNHYKCGMLIFTSFNAVKSVLDSIELTLSRLATSAEIKEYSSNLCHFIELPIFSIGPTTLEKLKTGIIDVFKKHAIAEQPKWNTVEAKCADELVPKIVAHAKSLEQSNLNSHTVFFCGNKSLKTIPLALEANNITYIQRIVYTTDSRDSEDILNQVEEAKDIFDGNKENLQNNDVIEDGFMPNYKAHPIHMCFFSPSGVDTIAKIAENISFLRENINNVVSIGETTATRIREVFGVENVHIAKSPSPQGIVNAIDSFY